MTTDLLLQCLIAMLVGLALHLAKKMKEFEDDGVSLSPIRYALAKPWNIVVTIGTCAASLFAMQEMGQLTVFAAFLTGFAGSSAADGFRSLSNINRKDIAELATEEKKEEQP